MSREVILGNAGKVFRTHTPASMMVWASISEREKSTCFCPSKANVNKSSYTKEII